jgi:hypothetical protein
MIFPESLDRGDLPEFEIQKYSLFFLFFHQYI